MKFIIPILAVLLHATTAHAQEISAAGVRTPLTIPNGGTGVATLPTGALKGAGTGAITQAGASDLSNGVIGSGAVVLAASPTVSGTLTTANVSVVGGSITFSTSNTKISAPIYMSNGSGPTPTGSCAIQTQSGGTNAGKFNANGACAAGTIIFTFGAASTTGWACQASDLTTPADALNETAYTTTTVTFTGTLVSGDLVTWSCFGF